MSECETVNMSGLEALWGKLDLSSKEEEEMDFSEDWGSFLRSVGASLLKCQSSIRQEVQSISAEANSEVYMAYCEGHVVQRCS